MDLKELYRKLVFKYRNKYGFTTYHETLKYNPDAKNWDGENLHLWTGQTNLLLKEVGLLDQIKIRESQREAYSRTVLSTMIVPGLNTRHAPAQLYLESEKWDAISLDEHDGIAFSASVFPSQQHSLEEIVSYGEEHGWAYLEHEPKVGAFPNTVLGWVEAMVGIFYVACYAVRHKDFSGSREMDKVIFEFPTLKRLSRVRLGKDRAFLRLIAGRKPGLLSYVHMCISIVFSAYKDKISGKNRSFYRILALRNVEFKGILFRISASLYDRKMKKEHGEKYMGWVTANYLWNGDHPMHVLSEIVEL